MARYNETHAVGWIDLEVEVTEEELREAIAGWWDDDATPDEILKQVVSDKIETLRDELSIDGVSIDWQGTSSEAETDVQEDFDIDPLELKAYGNKRTAL